MAAPCRQATAGAVRYISDVNRHLQHKHGSLLHSSVLSQHNNNNSDKCNKHFISHNPKINDGFCDKSMTFGFAVGFDVRPSGITGTVNKRFASSKSIGSSHSFVFNKKCNPLHHNPHTTPDKHICTPTITHCGFKTVNNRMLLRPVRSLNHQHTARSFSTSNIYRRWGDDEAQDNSGSRRKNLKLMDFPQLTKPSFRRSLNNFFLSLLIRGYYINDFSPSSFLDGAQTAVTVVSNHLSEGNFEALEGLVTDQALMKLRHNVNHLNDEEKQFIAVNPKDIIFRFIHEIGMIFDDETDRKIVEITAVWHGIHGWSSAKEKQQADPQEWWNNLPKHQQAVSDNSYVINYRFRKEVTKGVEDDWTVKVLNHFSV